jgi:hypothetical protein
VAVTIDGPAFEQVAGAGQTRGDGAAGQVADDPAIQLRAQRVRALRHTLAEYELPAFAVGPGRPLGEVLIS